MSHRSSIVVPRKSAYLAKRLAQPFSKRKLLRAARVIGPTLVALSFAGVANVAHAQGTMDFSGAQTLMGSFKRSPSMQALSSVSADSSSPVFA
jgi:hypothetical protein